MKRKVLCIDTEMSCWEDSQFQKRQVMEVFEFGMALVDLDRMEIVKTGRYYVKNERHEVSRFCTELTGITQRVLSRQGLPAENVVRLLKEKWGSKNKDIPIVAWGDERLWVERDCKEKGVDYPFHNNLINLASYYRFNEPTVERNTKLTDVCRQLNATIAQPLHSAKEDAETLANLLLKMVERQIIWPGLARDRS